MLVNSRFCSPSIAVLPVRGIPPTPWCPISIWLLLVQLVSKDFLHSNFDVLVVDRPIGHDLQPLTLVLCERALPQNEVAQQMSAWWCGQQLQTLLLKLRKRRFLCSEKRRTELSGFPSATEDRLVKGLFRSQLFQVLTRLEDHLVPIIGADLLHGEVRNQS